VYIAVGWFRTALKLNYLNFIFFFLNNRIETVHFAYTVQAVGVFVTVPTVNND
jgi:hypothetical protein